MGCFNIADDRGEEIETSIDYIIGRKPTPDEREALEIFGLNNRNFDLLITDVVMPNMGGVELVEIISKKDPNLKVLFTSGYTGEKVIRSGIKNKEINFLAKPYSIDVLAIKIREILES